MSNNSKIWPEIPTLSAEPPRRCRVASQIECTPIPHPEYRSKTSNRRSNCSCIIFALWRWFSQGGYIALRKANYGWLPHMMWTKDFVTFEEFTPAVDRASVSGMTYTYRKAAAMTICVFAIIGLVRAGINALFVHL
jgi:hypothetical protein